jgi:hypothetical protein
MRGWRNTESSYLRAEMMDNLLNLAMLACATVGSILLGILAAYGILRVGFGIMRSQPTVQIKASRPQPARSL